MPAANRELSQVEVSDKMREPSRIHTSPTSTFEWTIAVATPSSRLLPILGVVALLLTGGCCSYSKTNVHLTPDNQWHDVYENRGGEIQRILVTKYTRHTTSSLSEEEERSRCSDASEHESQSGLPSTETALRERDPSKPIEFRILDPTDFSLDGARKLMTINPGSALLARTVQEDVIVRVIIDFKRKHFWPEFGAQDDVE